MEYEWTCPFCGESRVNKQFGEDEEANAIAALRAHIIASEGVEHGLRNDFPVEFDTLSLDEYVIRGDGER